jgi:hypothetical protein
MIAAASLTPGGVVGPASPASATEPDWGILELTGAKVRVGTGS